MKVSHFILTILIFGGMGGASLLRAEDWTTTDGRLYPQVKVIKAEPDAVTILYRDGGALIPLTKLTSDLQKRFNYDPDRAEAAAEARNASDAESARALQAERFFLEQRQVALANASTESGTIPRAAAGNVVASSSESSSTHHSMSEITDSAHSLDRDLADPTYHTMEHFWYTSHTLSADPSDSNHHTMGEITNSGL